MDDPPDSEFQRAMGLRLRLIREALDLSQAELAEQMGIVTTTLSSWETGRNAIDIIKLARAATRFGFTTDWVARGDISTLRRDLSYVVEDLEVERRQVLSDREQEKSLIAKAEPDPEPEKKKRRRRRRW